MALKGAVWQRPRGVKYIKGLPLADPACDTALLWNIKMGHVLKWAECIPAVPYHSNTAYNQYSYFLLLGYINV